jgi:hypothetical protein
MKVLRSTKTVDNFLNSPVQMLHNYLQDMQKEYNTAIYPTVEGTDIRQAGNPSQGPVL